MVVSQEKPLYQYEKFNQFEVMKQEPIQVEKVEEEYQDGSIYYGEKENGLRHGFGKFSYSDGGIYEGEWKYGTMDGHGKLFYPSGKLAYDGNWTNNQFDKQGIVYNESPVKFDSGFNYLDFDGLDDRWMKYDGLFAEDFKEGYGTLFLANGEKFVGEFQQDMVSGKGEFHRINGETITGVWDNNQLVEEIN